MDEFIINSEDDDYLEFENRDLNDTYFEEYTNDNSE